MILDGTDLLIFRPRLPDELTGCSHTEAWEYYKTWYSHKFKRPAIKYEIGVHVRTGKIVWVWGPFRGATPDISIFRTELVNRLNKGEVILADRGYIGTVSIVTPSQYSGFNKITRLPEDRLLSCVRAKVEKTIGRIKYFNCCYHMFRHELKHHYLFFDVVCRLTNVNLKYEPLKSEREERAMGHPPDDACEFSS